MKKTFLSLSAVLLMTGLSALEIDNSYRIVISDKKEVQDVFAANELAGYLEKVSGKKYIIVTESDRSAAKAIYVGNTIPAAKAGKFVPDEFRIFVSGSDIIIAGSPERGVLFGVYEFLERFAGVRFFTPECERIPSKKVLKVPDDLNIQHKSAFEFRFIYGGKRAGNRTGFFRKMRLSGWDGGMDHGSSARFGTDGHCHTYYKYSKDFPKEISWADKSGSRNVVKSAMEGSICFSSPEVLKRFAERLKTNIAADRRKAKSQKLPPPQYYSVSQNDCDAACGCAECGKFISEHGVSGLVIDFTNRLADIVCRDYPEIKIQAFAYFDSLNPPKTEIHARKNVIVQISTYTQKYHDHLRSINDPVNREYKALVTAWKKSAGELGIWDYWRYFGGFKPSAPAALILPDYLRFYKESGVLMYFTEFETSPKDLLSFYDLTFYVGARMLDDPSRDPQPLINEFMETYYGSAAPSMKKLLELLTSAVSCDKVCGEQLRFDQRAYMKDPEFFRQAFALVNEAEKAVSGNQILKTRVHQEKLLLESSYLKAWNAHKNKLKLDRKELQDSIAVMLYPVLRSFFAPSILNKKVIAEAEHYYADKITFGKPQNIRAVPLPDFTANHPSAKIVECAKLPCSGRKISDQDSPSGWTFSHSANYSSEMREKRHRKPFVFGIYERTHAKYLVHGSIKPNAIPQDEKYHWYYAGTTELYPSLSLWMHWTWGLQVSLGRFYDENDPGKKYEIYFLLKLQGPAYVKNSENLNDVRLAAIAMKESPSEPADVIHTGNHEESRVVKYAIKSIRPKYRAVNYDPKKIAPYTLEDPLTFLSGKKVTSPEQWSARRKEILDIFAKEMYGQEPPRPECVKIELVEEKAGALAGFAVRSQYRMWFKKDKSGPCLDFLVLRPRFGTKKARPVLFLNYGGNHRLIPDKEVIIPEGMWTHSPDHKIKTERGVQCDPNAKTVLPIGMLLSNGFAVISCCYCQVSPDPLYNEKEKHYRQEPFAYTKIFELWGPRDESRTDNITALGAWAWSLSRGLDLAETIPELDAKNSIVTGCSRLGKAALLAAARDERFAVCVPVQCGGGGATLAKRDFGENISTETRMFRHWYCKAYDKYAADPAKLLTFDQHLLLAAVAPRKLLIAGFNNPWFDTEGEYLACKAASPAWKLHGKAPFPDVPFPADFDTSAIGPSLGYYRRSQEHGIADFDWLMLMRFANDQRR